MRKAFETCHKVCSKCGQKKPLKEFHKHKTSKYGKRADCKKCHYEQNKRYYKLNAEKNRDYWRKWRKRRAGYIKRYMKIYKEKNKATLKRKKRIYSAIYMFYKPWSKTLSNILKRCKPGGIYHKHGIKNFLNMKDLAYLWKRDNAHKMKKPSIDRKNPYDHYTFTNSRYIELRENIINSNLRKKRNKKGQYVKTKWGYDARKI